MERIKGWLRVFKKDLTACPDRRVAQRENFQALRQLLCALVLISLAAVCMNVLIFHKMAGLLAPAALAVFSLCGGACLLLAKYVRAHATLSLYMAVCLLLVFFAWADYAFSGFRAPFLFGLALLVLPLLILDTPWHLLILISVSMAAGLVLVFHANALVPSGGLASAFHTDALPSGSSEIARAASSAASGSASAAASGCVYLTGLIRLIPSAMLSAMLMLKVDISRLRAASREDIAEVHAQHDPLTGAYNRGGGTFFISECIRQKISGMYMICDIDNFKHVNDTYGHKAGDLVLQAVADALKASFNASDVVMRMGGDEFIVYSVGMVNEEMVRSRLDQVRRKVHQIVPDASSGENVTVSMGCVINDGSCTTYNELYQAADQMLYRTKGNGKDGFLILTPGMKGNQKA